ncbi:MAG: AzlD domain-containing protein [Desulfotomaculum sp.]|nr:AzlD domain-containing protein [Desulfotomaculum sp.]
MNDLLLIVIGMAAVTYIPRMLPLLLLDGEKLPPFLKTFLRYIPCATISALIFPGIFTSTESVESALSGTFIAVLLAFLGLNVVVVVFGGITGVFLWNVMIE